MILDLVSPLGRRVAAAQGRIESGQLANMRLYRVSTTVHTRLLGEARTLCGRSLFHNGQFAWQFINRGDVLAGYLPAHAVPGQRDVCLRCSASPVMRATAAIDEARRAAVTR